MPPRKRGPHGPSGTGTKTQPLRPATTAEATPVESVESTGGGGGGVGASVDSDGIRKALAQDYEVLEELGRGGMAIVYRALERELEREVAIKVLPPAMTMDGEFVDRFQREARTAGQLEHPNIVPIYRVGRKGGGDTFGVIFFVMKFLRGQSLAQVLRERPRLPVADVKRILVETAGALGYAAKRGVVHRDIKPDNIMLDGEGRCVVTDFGIAKTSSGPLTAAGTSMGTPRYMSPEHAQGTKLDGRSDLYSLGVVAYQCLSGSTPYDADDPFAILYKHINEPLPRPELETEEEWALYSVIERMLAKKPADRFQSAEDLIAALGGQALTGTLVIASATSPQNVFGPTEIIPTPPAGLRWTLPANWRLLAGAGGVLAVLGMATLIARPDGPATTDSIVLGAPVGDSAAPALAGADSGGVAAAETAPNAPADTAPTAAPVAVPPATQTAAAPVAPAQRASRPAPEQFSMCPRLPAGEATRALVVLVDQIPAQRRGDSVRVFYDVCGIASGGPYTADVEVRHIGRNFVSRLAQGTPTMKDNFISTANSPRTRRYRTVDVSKLPTGRYELTMTLTDGRRRLAIGKAEFEIVGR
ncbi:MAG: serine/threonine-protein kinase [Gemmatimonadaceae bacterium]